MSIHTEHPFATPEGDRDPLRRLRGRMAAPVTVWTTGTGAGRHGLTISSVVVAEGEPAHVLGLVDEDTDFWTSAPETVVVNLLGTPTGTWPTSSPAERRHRAECSRRGTWDDSRLGAGPP